MAPTNVRHVLDLIKNLIFLSTLDSFKYKFGTQGGVLKVHYSVGWFCRVLKLGIFIFSGHAITRTATISASSDQVSISLQLWHKRLDHRSERTV